MSREDKQVIDMVNAPWERRKQLQDRLKRLEEMARRARHRIAWRADQRSRARQHKAQRRERLASSTVAVAVGLVFVVMMFAIVAV